jgi:hypothetical protein
MRGNHGTEIVVVKTSRAGGHEMDICHKGVMREVIKLVMLTILIMRVVHGMTMMRKGQDGSGSCPS